MIKLLTHMKSLISFLLLSTVSAGSLSGQPANLRSFIDSFAAKNNFNGTIVIEEQSKVSYQKSFGLANFQFNIPNKIGTKYKVASITKLFTAVLIMQLYEQGKLDVDKHIRDYLPDYKGEGGDKITIHQLLNHTSGLPNIDTVGSMESALKYGVPLYQKPRSTDELLNDHCSGKPVNEPGKVFDYNNADYIILGKIIEKNLQQDLRPGFIRKNSPGAEDEKLGTAVPAGYHYRPGRHLLLQGGPEKINA